MLFEVRRQRIRGVPIPKHELSSAVPVRGDLRVQEGPAEAMGRRVCRVATLHALDRTIKDQLLPPLHDVCLLWMAPIGMVLGGIEFEGGAAFLQTWHCVPWERRCASSYLSPDYAARGCLSGASACAATTASRSGLSVTAPMGAQFRVAPDQRDGLRSRAAV
jgi:hypothetical protein